LKKDDMADEQIVLISATRVQKQNAGDTERPPTTATDS
jgi:hypothetical protein